MWENWPSHSIVRWRQVLNRTLTDPQNNDCKIYRVSENKNKEKGETRQEIYTENQKINSKKIQPWGCILKENLNIFMLTLDVNNNNNNNNNKNKLMFSYVLEWPQMFWSKHD